MTRVDTVSGIRGCYFTAMLIVSGLLRRSSPSWIAFASRIFV
jgi:hypothetical protein